MPRSFLAIALPPAANCATAPVGVDFGCLSAGVGVDFRVQNQEVDVLAGGDDMVETAVTDVIGPAVATDAPDRFLDQVISQRQQLYGSLVLAPLEGFLESNNTLTLFLDAGLVGLVGSQDLFYQRLEGFCMICRRQVLLPVHGPIR